MSLLLPGLPNFTPDLEGFYLSGGEEGSVHLIPPPPKETYVPKQKAINSELETGDTHPSKARTLGNDGKSTGSGVSTLDLVL